jgi:hypothetical protein
MQLNCKETVPGPPAYKIAWDILYFWVWRV